MKAGLSSGLGDAGFNIADIKKIEKFFGISPALSHGLGIIETGFVAGRLSALFGIGFEVLGFASQRSDSDELVIATAVTSRKFGEIAMNMQTFIPSIPDLEKASLLSINFPKGLPVAHVVLEVGASSATAIVVRLCKLLHKSLSYYLSRCSDVCDSSFSDMLAEAARAVVDANERLNFTGSLSSFTPSEQHQATRALLDLVEAVPIV